MSSEYDYGNARLRARLGQRLDRAAYDRLSSMTPDALLAALGETPHRDEARAAILRAKGLRAVQEAVRLHLGASLRAMRRFYDGRARSQVDWLLRRHDLANLRTVLRAQVQRQPAGAVEPLLVPAGTIDEAVLLDLASQPDIRACTGRMMAWRVPTARVAAAVAGALVEAGKNTGSARIEAALSRAFAEEVALALQAGDLEPDLARLLTDEIDRDNLLAALRLHGARERGEGDTPAGAEDLLAPGGRLSTGALLAATRHDARPDVLAALSAEPLRAEQRAALRAWANGGSLTELAAALEEAAARWAIGLLRTADPLSVAVPIAYAIAKETEARHLRLVAAAAAAPHPALIEARERWLVL
jgi:V/A-type H+-transporting ATPase subunit C